VEKDRNQQVVLKTILGFMVLVFISKLFFEGVARSQSQYRLAIIRFWTGLMNTEISYHLIGV
jgi:hypothetical protein